MLIVLLGLAVSLTIDPTSIQKSLFKTKQVIPEDYRHCNLTAGHDRILVGFNVIVHNYGTEVVRNYLLPWIMYCDDNITSGNILFNCLNDHCEDPDANRFFSCSISGLSPGCKTELVVPFCNYIDITNQTHCILSINDYNYTMRTVNFVADDFWVAFGTTGAIYLITIVLGAFCACRPRRS